VIVRCATSATKRCEQQPHSRLFDPRIRQGFSAYAPLLLPAQAFGSAQRGQQAGSCQLASLPSCSFHNFTMLASPAQASPARVRHSAAGGAKMGRTSRAEGPTAAHPRTAPHCCEPAGSITEDIYTQHTHSGRSGAAFRQCTSRAAASMFEQSAAASFATMPAAKAPPAAAQIALSHVIRHPNPQPQASAAPQQLPTATFTAAAALDYLNSSHTCPPGSPGSATCTAAPQAPGRSLLRGPAHQTWWPGTGGS
jgi:hypothetical protein